MSQDRKGVLLVEGNSVEDIAKKYGTPVYVFSEREIRTRMRRFKAAFPYPKLRVQLAGKTNSSLEILKMAREEGLDFDASSVGEIILGLIADFRPTQITFTNLYKTEQDIMFAAKVGVHAITADSYQELQRIANAGKKLGKKIRTFIRVNLMIDYGSHYTTRHHQYGIPHAYAKKNIDFAIKSKHIDLVGLHFHGSYISNPQVYSIAANRLIKLAKYATEKGANIRCIDLGGGFPVEWGTKRVFQPEDMGESFIRYFRKTIKKAGLTEPTLIFEPGKFITANAGLGLVKVVSRKQLPKEKLVITDGSTYAFVPDVIIYHCYYDILPATKMKMRRSRIYNIVGCTCDSIDVIGKRRWLPKLYEGDLLAIMDIGAYSHVMASNFNSLKKAPIVMVMEDGSMKLVKRRDRYCEMFAPELDVLKMADPNELRSLYLLRESVDKAWKGKLQEKKPAKRKKSKAKRRKEKVQAEAVSVATDMFKAPETRNNNKKPAT